MNSVLKLFIAVFGCLAPFQLSAENGNRLWLRYTVMMQFHLDMDNYSAADMKQLP